MFEKDLLQDHITFICTFLSHVELSFDKEREDSSRGTTNKERWIQN